MQIKKQYFTIKLEKQAFRFNSAHFLCSQCDKEPLHGHNYRLMLELKSHTIQQGLVADFRDLKKFIKPICDKLHTKTLIPIESKIMQIQTNGDSTEIKIPLYNCEYKFPTNDLYFLQSENSSCEEIAKHLTTELLKSMPDNYLVERNIKKMKLGVSESEGQMGVYCIEFQ